MSDFKTNEYANLLGGAEFEPAESNPMLGFRGASRYAHPAYAEGFALECAAMRRVRDEMGLTNVMLMIPFCGGWRRPTGPRADGRARAASGARTAWRSTPCARSPTTCILIDEFASIFDGFSIGSNDLTQLTLGVDRDSEIVAFDYDERDEGVKEMIRLAVEGCRRNSIHSGLCGQAPSDYPDMAEYLVETRDRLDEPESRHGGEDHPPGARPRGEAGSLGRRRTWALTAPTSLIAAVPTGGRGEKPGTVGPVTSADPGGGAGP